LRRLFALSVLISVLSMSVQSRGQVFEYVGSTLWSGVKDVQVVDNYAYCAVQNGLMILDILDPEKPEIIGRYYYSEGGRTAIEVVGQFAYLTAGTAGLVILDVSDPSNPLYIGSYDTPDCAVDVAISINGAERYAYVADIGSLQVINVTEPASPAYIGFYSAWACDVEKVFMDGNYAYLALLYRIDLTGRLEIVDMSNPSNPNYIGGYGNYNIDIQGLFIRDGYAYIANSWYEYPGSPFHGLLVLDVSNPANPTFITRAATGHPATSITLSGNYAYLTELLTLIIYDITNPANPNPVGSCSGARNYSVGSSVSDDVFYGADGGLNLFDVSNPSSPALIGNVARGETHGVAIRAELACRVGSAPGFQIFDISDPILPKPRGSYETQDIAGSVFLQGIYAYVPDGSEGVKIINISNASGPVLVGVYDNPSGGARQVFAYEDVLYVGIDESGIDIVDVSDPANPVLVGQSPIPSYAIRGIDVSDGHLYALASYPLNQMYIFDISDPLHPITKGTYDIEYPNGIFVAGNIAYVVSDAGLGILDVSDPSNISLIGGYATPDWAKKVYVVGNTALVSVNLSGLLALDVSDPANVTMLQSIDTPGRAYDIAVSNGYIFLADVYSLIIFRMLQSEIPDDGEYLPPDFALSPNYPNPFNVTTTIQYDLPYQTDVKIDFFDLLGRKIKTLNEGLKPAGKYSILWNADGYSSGIYFYKMTAGEYSQSRRCTLIK